WRSPEECPRRIRRCFSDAQILLGTMGSVSQAMRGKGPGQFAKMEDGRLTTNLRFRALQRSHSIVTGEASRKRDRSASIFEAAEFSETDRARCPSAERGHDSRSIHGLRFYDCRRRRLRIEEHRA